MSIVILNGARSRFLKRQNTGSQGKKKSADPENMVTGDAYQGKAFQECNVGIHKTGKDGFVFGDTKRRVLSDSCNLMNQEYAPTAAKKAKGMKIPVVTAKPKETLQTNPTATKKKIVQKSKNFHVQTPHRILRDVEPMDTGESGYAIQSVFTKLPSGVIDIDANINDPCLCPKYAQDIINYVQCIEQRWILKTDYLEGREVTPYMRSVLIDWLIQVQDHLGLQQETLHLCVSIIDRYLTMKAVALSEMQLLGITCLFIASKFYERLCPEVSTLVHLTDNTYTYDDVIKTELRVLHTLRFDLSVPSAVFFMDRLHLVEDITEEAQNTTKYILDLTLTNYDQVRYASSLRAASAVFLARLLWDEEDPWTLNLAYYSKYSERDLVSCAENMMSTLAKSHRSKIQGARNKYNSISRYNAISNDPRITNAKKLTQHLVLRGMVV